MMDILKNTLFVVNIALSIAMLISALSVMHSKRLGLRTDELFSNYNKCFLTGNITKIIYWLIIPEPTQALTKMFTYDIKIALICIAVAFVYMLPLHLVYKGYRKNQSADSVKWIVKSASTIIILYIISYLISVPIP